ncbi:MAG: FAD:protein FMN transferase [Firmicutes bacterium]|nr:FAD:protein FMN transferase [Bacillota bacterium]
MKKNKTVLVVAILGIAAACSLITLLLTGKPNSPASRTEFALDTICTITLYEWDGAANEILDNAFDICADYEKLLSATVSESDIYKINHSNGKAVTVNSETASIISDALEYCRLSDGAFDITILPVKNLWKFGSDGAAIPDSEAITKMLGFVDYTKISIDGCNITLPKGMGIDLGAIAKGYITDRVAEYLKQQNVTSAVIDFGGNVYAIGSKPDGSNWKIGIQKPFADSSEQSKVVEVSNSSVVTSGVYQRYFEQGGNIYHHILNAKTGMPCDTGLYSVTVISENSEKCDALSTVCMLLGYEKSAALLSEMPDVQATFITSDYKIISI